MYERKLFPEQWELVYTQRFRVVLNAEDNLEKNVFIRRQRIRLILSTGETSWKKKKDMYV